MCSIEVDDLVAVWQWKPMLAEIQARRASRGGTPIDKHGLLVE